MTGQPDDPIVHLLSSLIEANVEFIVVGGAAAVLSGVPVVTKDLDIVHKRSPENIERLLSVLSPKTLRVDPKVLASRAKTFAL